MSRLVWRFQHCPSYQPSKTRVDPDAWLATLDQKVYLRHVGRDGCVDVDLATYYLGPQMAGWTVLFQVGAQSRQFAVWHQDHIVKRLPIKGLGGQEMALSDYLQSIRASGVGCPATVSYSFVQESPTAVSLGGRRLISSFIRQLSQALALHWSKCGKPVVSLLDKDAGEPVTICCMSSLCV